MRKKISILAAGMAAVMMLGGCGFGGIGDMIGEKLEDIKGGDTEEAPEKEGSQGSTKTEQDGAETLALLGDLMGENMGNANEGKPSAPSLPSSAKDDDDESDGDKDAPENQVVVTEADEWQGIYYGTVKVIGFGNDYSGIEEEYEGYAIVKIPSDDFPFMEIYSDDFDIWDNIDFSYDGQALVSMYVNLTDDMMQPVVYKFGDAYVIDVSLTDADAQVFTAKSDGKSPARIVAQYNYEDPEDGADGGMLMLFDLTKESLYD